MVAMSNTGLHICLMEATPMSSDYIALMSIDPKNSPDMDMSSHRDSLRYILMLVFQWWTGKKEIEE
jgi:hypothetical protein